MGLMISFLITKGACKTTNTRFVSFQVQFRAVSLSKPNLNLKFSTIESFLEVFYQRLSWPFQCKLCYFFNGVLF